MEERFVEDYINQELKEYAISVVEERALPSVIDGFKPVQRKIMFTADKVARKAIKTAALVGNVITIGGYYKGDVSIAGAAGKMAQDFAGANNYPFLKGEGEFGKRLTPNGVAAPRYTETQLHGNFDLFFKDKELLVFDEQDGDYHEPRYYLPIIPTVLLNGVSGIAVGFACSILPYDPKEIVNNVERVLKAKKQKPLVPFFRDYNGTIKKEEDGKFVMYGVWERMNSTTISITELPVGVDREKYIEHLISLEEKGTIKKFDDLCKKEWRFNIYFTREALARMIEKGTIEKIFKLKMNLNNNLNVITEKGRLKSFDTPEEIVEYFVNFRLNMLTERKLYFQGYFQEKISFIDMKIKFIRAVVDGDINVKMIKSKSHLRDIITQYFEGKIPDDVTEKLINIPIYQFNDNEINKLEASRDDFDESLDYYANVGEGELYADDIKLLKEGINKSKKR